MNKRKIIISVSIFLVMFIIAWGFFQFLFVLPMRNILNTCEERGWDGSEIEYGREPFTGDPQIVKCNKNDETEAIIDLIDGASFSTTYRSMAERISDKNKWQEED